MIATGATAAFLSALGARHQELRLDVLHVLDRSLPLPAPSRAITASRRRGIWTTDIAGGRGYNAGQASLGDAAGNYSNSFGGTSSAAPGVAGVAGLVLARNPNLRWDEVKDILKRCCDQIDKPTGAYDQNGHSKIYGFGRVNAKAAVELAAPAVAPGAPKRVAIRTDVVDVPIVDLQTSQLTVAVADTTPLKAIKIGVDIEHTFIGDLVVSVKPPSSLGVAPIVLHSRSGGGTQNIKQTYDAVNAPGLSALVGAKPQGTWTLVVKDEAAQDVGRIRSFSVELSL